jgi:hypothetical protein
VVYRFYFGSWPWSRCAKKSKSEGMDDDLENGRVGAEGENDVPRIKAKTKYADADDSDEEVCFYMMYIYIYIYIYIHR